MGLRGPYGYSPGLAAANRRLICACGVSGARTAAFPFNESLTWTCAPTKRPALSYWLRILVLILSDPPGQLMVLRIVVFFPGAPAIRGWYAYQGRYTFHGRYGYQD